MEKKEQFEPWQLRLKEERKELIEKMKYLAEFYDNPNSKMNSREWDLLKRQLYSMKDYASALTERCKLYGLIEEEINLNLFYR